MGPNYGWFSSTVRHGTVCIVSLLGKIMVGRTTSRSRHAGTRGRQYSWHRKKVNCQQYGSIQLQIHML